MCHDDRWSMMMMAIAAIMDSKSGRTAVSDTLTGQFVSMVRVVSIAVSLLGGGHLLFAEKKAASVRSNRG